MQTNLCWWGQRLEINFYDTIRYPRRGFLSSLYKFFQVTLRHNRVQTVSYYFSKYVQLFVARLGIKQQASPWDLHEESAETCDCAVFPWTNSYSLPLLFQYFAYFWKYSNSYMIWQPKGRIFCWRLIIVLHICIYLVKSVWTSSYCRLQFIAFGCSFNLS
jgi:hypothetical protein